MDNKFLDIYIPRMLGNITQKTIKESFHNLQIGKVFYIDMYKKINENGYPYYFAFLKLSLYDTSFAKVVEDRILKKKIMHLVYKESDNQYWELKQHIPRENREAKKENLTNTSFYNLQEKQRLLEEYEELEKKIFSLCC